MFSNLFCCCCFCCKYNYYYFDCAIWPHKRAAHPVVFRISVGRDLQTSMVILQLPNTMVLIQLLNIRVGTQLCNCLSLRQTTQLSVYMPQSQLPTDFFSKSSNHQDHHFRAWRHSHSSSFPIWGCLWQLWLSYPLRTSVNCTQCLCTWTKSRIVQRPTKLNYKI